MNPKRKVGIALLICGIVISLFAFVLIGNDLNGQTVDGHLSFYTYTPPYSSHELGRLIIMGVGIVLLIVGIVKIIKGKKT